MVSTKNLIIGITGTMTSGKGALEFFLVNRGFKHVRLTQPIIDYGISLKSDMTDRSKWQEIIIDFRKKQGLDILAKKASEKFEEGERYVVSPIRNPEDIKYLKKNYNALIIFIDAPFEDRYKRTFLKDLGRPLSKEEFKEKDDSENEPSGENKKYFPNINECKKLADEIIINDGTLNDLNEKLDKVMRKYRIPDVYDTDIYEGVNN